MNENDAFTKIFMVTNGKYFKNENKRVIRDMLLNSTEVQWMQVASLQFNDPATMLIISILGGTLGVDRFLIGQTMLGILKLVTCGGFGLWTVIDWFLIMDEAKKSNFEKLQDVYYQ